MDPGRSEGCADCKNTRSNTTFNVSFTYRPFKDEPNTDNSFATDKLCQFSAIITSNK